LPRALPTQAPTPLKLVAHCGVHGAQLRPLGGAAFESFANPSFQFAAASGTGKLTRELAKGNLVFLRDLAIFDRPVADIAAQEVVDSPST
jgi:hypothetical protein